MHAELNAFGQIIAISECFEEAASGNTMQFCLHMGTGFEAVVNKAYELLKDGAKIDCPIGECPFSPLMFSLVDKFGVMWCVFI